MKIEKLIKQGESELLEFKESFHSNQEISKQICAFANTDGGSLLIGVKDNGQIVGIKENLDKVQQKVSNSNQNIHAMPIITCKVHEILEKKILEVVVQKSSEGHVHTFEGRVFVRIETTVKKLEGQTLLDFLKNKHILCFDEIESELSIKEIETSKIEYYLALRDLPNYLKKHTTDQFLKDNLLMKKNKKLKIQQRYFLVKLRQYYILKMKLE